MKVSAERELSDNMAGLGAEEAAVLAILQARLKASGARAAAA